MNIGDSVADFELPDQDGQPRRLSALLSNGPVVLFFYPGGDDRWMHRGELPLPRSGR